MPMGNLPHQNRPECQPRHSCQVGRQGEDILKVHASGSSVVLTELEGGGGSDGRRDHIHEFKGFSKSCLMRVRTFCACP
jgi:hypothetical protein